MMKFNTTVYFVLVNSSTAIKLILILHTFDDARRGLILILMTGDDA